ncbi:hypothetical protein ABT112_26875 [Streptomyces sp. NPDC002055]|uniref:hypothetical protein n=1 Tax=Streptomyces sp. NPDC002055 TaxID=3154534 RepID=UPI003328FF91
MSLNIAQLRLLRLYAAREQPVVSTVYRTPEPSGGVGDPVWERWSIRQEELGRAVVSLVSRELIAVAGPRVPGQPDRVEVTEAGYAALREQGAVLQEEAAPYDVGEEVPGGVPGGPAVEAWDLLDEIARARGWAGRAQMFGPGRARLMVREERRWLGLTISPSRVQPLAHLAAGLIEESGQPAGPLLEQASTAAVTGDLSGLLGEVEQVWERLDAAGHG